MGSGIVWIGVIAAAVIHIVLRLSGKTKVGEGDPALMGAAVLVIILGLPFVRVFAFRDIVPKTPMWNMLFVPICIVSSYVIATRFVYGSRKKK